MFVLKKIVSRLFFPLSLIIELLLVGLLWPKKRKKFLIIGIGFLFLFSFNPFAIVFLWPLESRFPPLAESSIQKDIKWVVVLGGGVKGNKGLTPEDRLHSESLKRLLEGLRICRHIPKAQLILSGGDYQGAFPVARVMQDVALSSGFRPSRIVLEESSWDTQDEAQFLKNQLGTDSFYLVTSASHMPRSMALFKKVGTKPLAAPTDFQAVWEPVSVTFLFPQANALFNTERAFYEYLGFLWGWVRGYL
jgi:uncharacterized SAM-binding protein YcdF (DUF218 family)